MMMIVMISYSSESCTQYYARGMYFHHRLLHWQTKRIRDSVYKHFKAIFRHFRG